MWSKNIFFTILYRNPSSNYTSLEFQTFLKNFENLYSKIKAEKPLATFFTGDFNAHTQQIWWPDGNTTSEGTELQDLFTTRPIRTNKLIYSIMMSLY